MKLRILLIANLGVLWLMANLPANLLRQFIDSDQLTLVAPQGSLWHGSGRLVSNLGLQAQVQWQTMFWPLGLNLHLTDKDSDIHGRLKPTLSNHLGGYRLTLEGQLGATTLAPLLQRYNLFVPGTFRLNNTEMLMQQNQLRLSQPSSLQWSGGAVRYILANRQYQAAMPPLRATLVNNDQGHLEAKIYGREANSAPLLILRAAQNGNVYFAVSRGMLGLANYPWSGNEAADELIFEVQRSLNPNPR
tara:strand:+ start:351 stop:1088 length:738 start_codon:yes stop_codon:yes gene_type:complete